MTFGVSLTKLPNRWVFLDACTSPERVWTLLVLLADSHQPALTLKSTRRLAHYSETNIVVSIVVVVTRGRAAIVRIIDPGATPHQLFCPPRFYFSGCGRSRSVKIFWRSRQVSPWARWALQLCKLWATSWLDSLPLA
jgi:hypothetical protein